MSTLRDLSQHDSEEGQCPANIQKGTHLRSPCWICPPMMVMGRGSSPRSLAQPPAQRKGFHTRICDVLPTEKPGTGPLAWTLQFVPSRSRLE